MSHHSHVRIHAQQRKTVGPFHCQTRRAQIFKNSQRDSSSLLYVEHFSPFHSLRSMLLNLVAQVVSFTVNHFDKVDGVQPINVVPLWFSFSLRWSHRTPSLHFHNHGNWSATLIFGPKTLWQYHRPAGPILMLPYPSLENLQALLKIPLKRTLWHRESSVFANEKS